jgi:hypothetical protein
MKKTRINSQFDLIFWIYIVLSSVAFLFVTLITNTPLDVKLLFISFLSIPIILSIYMIVNYKELYYDEKEKTIIYYDIRKNIHTWTDFNLTEIKPIKWMFFLQYNYFYIKRNKVIAVFLGNKNLYKILYGKK